MSLLDNSSLVNPRTSPEPLLQNWGQKTSSLGSLPCYTNLAFQNLTPSLHLLDISVANPTVTPFYEISRLHANCSHSHLESQVPGTGLAGGEFPASEYFLV